MSITPREKQEQQDNLDQQDPNDIYLTDNSTLQTPEEAAADKNRQREDDRIETRTAADVDIDGLAESDRAGTNERKG